MFPTSDTFYFSFRFVPIFTLLFYIYSVTGAMGICFPYLGEFQATKYREKCLCWMEMFWTVGVIVLPRESHLVISFIRNIPS